METLAPDEYFDRFIMYILFYKLSFIDGILNNKYQKLENKSVQKIDLSK